MAPASTLTFLREQTFGKPTPASVPLDGSTVIVTGANVGLGFEAAVQFAKMNPAHLILGCRSAERGEEARRNILERSDFKGKLEVWSLDLASFDSVKAFAAKCETDLERLDIVCQNAAIGTSNWSKTKDGWESTLQVNVLATGLFAILLLPLLGKTGSKYPNAPVKPHMSIVGSEAHVWGGDKERKVGGRYLDALNSEEHTDMNGRYQLSKLLLWFLVQEIAALPAAQGVVTNFVNPGLCVSELLREQSAIVIFLLRLFARTTEVGAYNLAWGGITDTNAIGKPGAYVSVCSVTEPSAFATSPEGLKVQEQFWGEVKEEYRKISPDIGQLI